MRVVLDSSVLIAAHVTRAGACAELYEEALQHHDLVLSRHIIDEVARKLRMTFLIGEPLVLEAFAAMTRAAEIVEPCHLPREACRDPDDLPVLGTAAAGRAELLVTVDNDLLDLGSFEATAIIRPGEFWKHIHA